ncbi:hypothetical protein PYK79_56415 [Streptomyces sp. ID05-04B]|uniref:hypothetical protein n=1 Tax=unclassified Streptomyces TaxID=2593676 RepID=UPI000D1BF1C2|nr:MULTISPECIES: hypothetical protein [unclassified Streptomyces]AVV46442.1 hypothetical protein C6376_38895 [Streptomyces sp. P3]AVV46501.1 hypothetical protein C6376_39195 [Streptomyces sp. P3]MDX5570816.1 hypothetical protein [Streptomyces sp. ID05-04B]
MATSPERDQLAGAYGTARRVVSGRFLNSHPAGLDSWILTGPRWHPVWYQYNLGIVSLADTPGLPPAKLHRPGVTHELTLVALDPEGGPYDARHLPDEPLRFLTPVNIVEQVTTTDARARELAFLCARAVVDGRLWPETGDAPDHVRATWRNSIHQTLTHHD